MTGYKRRLAATFADIIADHDAEFPHGCPLDNCALCGPRATPEED